MSERTPSSNLGKQIHTHRDTGQTPKRGAVPQDRTDQNTLRPSRNRPARLKEATRPTDASEHNWAMSASERDNDRRIKERGIPKTARRLT